MAVCADYFCTTFASEASSGGSGIRDILAAVAKMAREEEDKEEI